MPKITLNGITMDAPENATLLEAASKLGIQIPTLCHAEGKRPNTSCMVCVVEEVKGNRLLPSCAARVEDGMVIETDSETVRRARRAALELLMSEHLGDCEAPCERACPAGLNIPLMLRLLARGEMQAARTLARQALVLPAALGRVCTAPCEAGCRRGCYDEAVAIRELHGRLGEIPYGDAELPVTAPASGKIVAVIGSGPAGLAAAYVVRVHGHTCRVYEKRAAAGGVLRDFPEARLPGAVLDEEINRIARMGVDFIYGVEAGKDLSLDQLLRETDAVIIACGIDAPPQSGLFRAKEQHMPVRSVASGKVAARAVHDFLIDVAAPVKNVYHSIVGRIPAEQMGAYVIGRASPEALRRSRDAAQMGQEAERCLHCDCHVPVSCKLRRYAAEYGARPKAFRDAERPLPDKLQRYGEVIFDVGKCIRCGLCVQITEEHRESLGLTFAERGFAMRVSVPFGEALGKALALCGRACVEACPTGALAFESKEERMGSQE